MPSDQIPTDLCVSVGQVDSWALAHASYVVQVATTDVGRLLYSLDDRRSETWVYEFPIEQGARRCALEAVVASGALAAPLGVGAQYEPHSWATIHAEGVDRWVALEEDGSLNEVPVAREVALLVPGRVWLQVARRRAQWERLRADEAGGAGWATSRGGL